MAGVVQGAAKQLSGGIIPVLITKYVEAATTKGVKKKGKARNGFITIGKPKRNGSLMLKIPGTNSNLPID